MITINMIRELSLQTVMIGRDFCDIEVEEEKD